MCNAHCTVNYRSNISISSGEHYFQSNINKILLRQYAKKTDRMIIYIRVVHALSLDWALFGLSNVLNPQAHLPTDEDKSSMLGGNASQVHFTVTYKAENPKKNHRV